MANKMTARTLLVAALLAACPAARSADYAGPRPPKPDVPFLLHADRLVETEKNEAKEVKAKNDTAYVVNGAASPARTPLPEPVFVLLTKDFVPEKIELYRMQVRNGNREVVLGPKRKRTEDRPIHMLVTRLAERLYKLEVDEPLEDGEYCLTPEGANAVFCFQIY